MLFKRNMGDTNNCSKAAWKLWTAFLKTPEEWVYTDSHEVLEKPFVAPIQLRTVVTHYRKRLKGLSNEKLTGVESDISQKVFLSHWTDDISFLNSKGTCFFKGTVQQKLTGVVSYTNQKVFPYHWTTDILFLKLKGTCSLNCQKPVSAA